MAGKKTRDNEVEEVWAESVEDPIAAEYWTQLWTEVWEEFDDWFEDQQEYCGCCGRVTEEPDWEEQKAVIMELVEEHINLES